MFEDFESAPAKTAEQIALEIVKTKAEIEKKKEEQDILDEELAFVQAEAKPIDDEIKKIREMLAELESKKQEKTIARNKIVNKTNKVINKKADVKYDISLKQSKIKELEAELHKANMHLLKAQKLAEEGDLLDIKARKFSWYPQFNEHGDQISGAYKHQIDAGKQMTVLNKVVLGDEMGLGKSLTAQIACDLLGSKKILVISKIEVIGNFKNEFEKWSPHRNQNGSTIFSLPGLKRSFQKTMLGNVLPLMDKFVVLMNFESYWTDKDMIPLLQKLQFDTVIFDEAHHMKEDKKKTFKGFKQLLINTNKCCFCGKGPVPFKHGNLGGESVYECSHCYLEQSENDARSIKNIFPMTGSPILNRPDEFFPLLNCIDPKQFPSLMSFRERYCRRETYENLRGNIATRWAFRPGGSDALMNSIGPQFIRRTKKDAGIIIPPQEIKIHKVPFSEETHPLQYRAYQDLEEFAGMLFDKEQNGFPVATAGGSLITRLRQITSWPAGITIHGLDFEGKVDKSKIEFQCDVKESAKLDAAFEELLERLENGERVVVFAKHTAVIEEYYRRCQQYTDGEKPIRAAKYYGDTNNFRREEIKIDFDASRWDPDNYKWDVLICQNETASQGLNFTAAQHMQVLERMWNPKLEEQMLARTARIGQKLETSVSIFELEDTIDDMISYLLETKKIDINQFEESSDNVALLLSELFKRAKAKQIPEV